MTEAREAYLDALGTRDEEKLKAAFQRAHEIRKFEIDLYWKRATYFWLLQAAVFTAFGLVGKDAKDPQWGLIAVGLAGLGILTSFAGWLSAQGSKFWQSNWEFHIDMLEDDFEGRLHKTAGLNGLGVRWSVSGINDRLSLCFVFFWVLVTIAAAMRAAGPEPIRWGLTLIHIDLHRTLIVSILVATTAGVILLAGRLSELRGELVQIGSTSPGAPLQKLPRLSIGGARGFWILKRETRW